MSVGIFLGDFDLCMEYGHEALVALLKEVLPDKDRKVRDAGVRAERGKDRPQVLRVVLGLWSVGLALIPVETDGPNALVAFLQIGHGAVELRFEDLVIWPDARLPMGVQVVPSRAVLDDEFVGLRIRPLQQHRHG